MEHWAAFTTEVQPSKSSTSTPASESSTKADPAWEQFQREMKAKKEKVIKGLLAFDLPLI